MQASNWLGPFIEDEIKKVIAWKSGTQKNTKVKRDPVSRFEDDHSNFRSTADASILPPEARLQISKVTSTQNAVTLLVTDGFTRIKARLSDDALATLEDELGDAVDLGTKGDVFAVQKVVVESTPYGPSDGFIQLVIEKIEYLYHLRKPMGEPKPVEERAEVVLLIGDITQLRRTQLLSDYGQIQSTSNSRHMERTSTPDASRKSTSPHSTRLSQTASPSGSQPLDTQQPLATQIPDRRRAQGPTLSKDGFEAKDGVNLARPTQPNIKMPDQRSVKTTRQQLATMNGTSGLFNLLTTNKTREADDARQPETQQPSITTQTIQAEPVLDTADVAPMNEGSVPLTIPPVDVDVEISTPPAKRRRTVHHFSKISKDQQALLDKPSSWIPSLPGYTFPHPNVPLALLKAWNAKAAVISAEKQEASTLRDDGEDSSPIDAPNNPQVKSPSHTSDDEESSEEELLSWSSTPEKPTRPPDSSFQQHQPSPGSKHGLLVPQTKNTFSPSNQQPHRQAMRDPNSLASVSQPQIEMQTTRPPSSSASTPSKSQALPQRPHWIPKNISRPPSSSSKSTEQRLRPMQNYSRPSTGDSRASANSSKSPAVNFMNSVSTILKRSSQSSRSSPATAVKASRIGSAGSDDLEMSVPRSLDRVPSTSRNARLSRPAREVEDASSQQRDPAVLHRQRRSEHFKSAQRRQWLERNAKSNGNTPLKFTTLFQQYKKAYPNDEVRLSEFAEPFEEIAREMLERNDEDARLTRGDADDVAPSAQKHRRTLPAGWNHGSQTPDLSKSLSARDALFVSQEPENGKAQQKPSTTIEQQEANPFRGFAKPARDMSKKDNRTNTARSKQAKGVSEQHVDVPQISPDTPVASISQDIPSSNGQALESQGSAGLSVFAEFARAWKNIQPGGAFFEEAKQKRLKRGVDDCYDNEKKKATRLNVLSWSL